MPKCAACGERLSPFVDNDKINRGIPCFCKGCLSAWQRARVQMCHSCGNTAPRCTCMPLKSIFMQPSIPSLFFYHPDDNSPRSRAIFTLKCKKHTELYNLVAAELGDELLSLLKELNIKPEDCIFTYIPRTDGGLIKNGFDQSRLLAQRLSRSIGGAACLPLLSRDGGAEQKKLSTKERRKNADSSIHANVLMKGSRADTEKGLGVLLKNKTVIITDDIMTSGASMSRGISVLKDAGAESIIAAVVARCEISGNPKTSTKKDQNP